MKMGIYATKGKWQRGLEPVIAVCVRNRIHPDIFTYGALGLSVTAGYALFAAGSNRAWLWVVTPCVLVRLVLNLMDGLVARELELGSTWGEVKNEFGDRLADAAIFLGLCFGGYADARLAALAIVSILCVSYLGILGKAIGGARVYGGVFGKGDRMIALALFTLYPIVTGNLGSYNAFLIGAAVAAHVTIIQRLKVIHEYTQSVG
jgi:CDP-diacylglycerol---glycerol-3-phosphate 3-phosphatidyltransferase